MSSARLTISQAVALFQTHRSATFSAATIRNDGYFYARFTRTLRDIQLRSLTPAHVEGFFSGPGGCLHQHIDATGRTRPPVSASTAAYYIHRLKALFDFLSKRHLCRSDLLDLVVKPKITRRKRIQLTADQMDALVEGADNPRDRALLALAANTGCRAAELLRLRVGDVDFTNDTLHVEITKSRTEDDKPLTRDLAVELRRWLKEYTRHLFVRGQVLLPDHYLLPARIGPKYLWTGPMGGPRVRTHSEPTWVPDKPMTHPQRAVQAGLERLGIESRGEGLHTLRRSAGRAYFDFLSRDLAFDGALRVTAAFLNHQNTGSTQGYLQMTADTATRDVTLKGKSFLASTRTLRASNVASLPQRR